MDKTKIMRILQCTLFYVDGMPELEINKHFNFKEMDKSKEIMEIIEKEIGYYNYILKPNQNTTVENIQLGEKQ